MKVAVVIINFNRKDDTLECLFSLKRTKSVGFKTETIVVDNASNDTSVQFIKSHFPETHILINAANLGFAEGNNIGIRYALNKQCDYIYMLNNDTVVDSDCLIELIKQSQINKNIGIFGPKIYFFPGCETHKSRYNKSDLGKVLWYTGGMIDWDNVLASHRGVDEVDKSQYNEIVKTQFISGCAMFVPHEIFTKIGMFDRRYYLYYEDVDLCQKAKKKGIDSIYVPKAVVWHKNAESSGGTGSDLQNYYITRNRMLFGMRYAPWRTKLSLFREAVNLLLRGTKTEKQAIGDYLRRNYGSRK